MNDSPGKREKSLGASLNGEGVVRRDRVGGGQPYSRSATATQQISAVNAHLSSKKAGVYIFLDCGKVA